MGTKKTAAVNTTFIFASSVFSLLLSLILIRIYIDFLGKEIYGLWILAASVIAYFEIIKVGFSTSDIKYIVEYNEKRDWKGLNSYIVTSVYSGILISLATFLIAILLSTIIISGFNVQGHESLAISIYLVVILSSVISFPLRPFAAVIEAKMKYSYYFKIQTFFGIFLFAYALLILYTTRSIIYLLIGNLIINFLKALVQVLIAKKIIPEIQFSSGQFRKDILKHLINFSVLRTILYISELMIFRTDSIVIGIYMTVGAIAIYSVGFKLYSMLNTTMKQFISLTFQYGAKYNAKGQKEKLQKLIFTGTRYLNSVVMLFSIPLFILAPDVIKIWIGRSDFSEAIVVTRILLIGLVVYGIHGVVYRVMTTENKTMKLPLIYMILVAAFNLILSIILVKKYGITGVALGTTIPFVVFEVYIIYGGLKTYGINFRDFARKCLSRTYFVSLVSLIPSVIVYKLLNIGLYRIFTVSAIYVALYSYLSFMVVLNNTEKSYITKKINYLFSKSR